MNTNVCGSYFLYKYENVQVIKLPNINTNRISWTEICKFAHFTNAKKYKREYNYIRFPYLCQIWIGTQNYYKKITSRNSFIIFPF